MKKNIYGWIGMILVQGSSMPQIIKAMITKDVSGVSWLFWIALCIGLSCYLIYAFKIRTTVYKVSNLIGITFCLIMLGCLYFYK